MWGDGRGREGGKGQGARDGAEIWSTAEKEEKEVEIKWRHLNLN